MKGLYVPSQREILTDRWESLINIDLYEKVDIDSYKELLYDTYRHFYQSREFNSVLCADLSLFRCMCAVQYFTDTPSGNTEAEFAVCQYFAEGLVWAVENQFRRGYYEQSIPIELSVHGSHNEADMSSFDSFSKEFDKLIKNYKEEFEEYDDEEEED